MALTSAEKKTPASSKNTESSKPKQTSRLRKRVLLVAIGVGVLIGLVACFWYAHNSISASRVAVTNVTSRSATISWVSRSKSPGMVIVSEDGYKLPLKLTSIGSDKLGYDDRDFSRAEMREAIEVASKASNAEGVDVEYSYSSTKVMREDVGWYYTHHVTVTGLEPEKEYEFMVGNGVFFAKKEIMYTGGTKFQTVKESENLNPPEPLFGKVVQLSGQNAKTAPVNDAVITVRLKNADGLISEALSSVTSDNGTWYVDISSVEAVDGNAFGEINSNTEVVVSVTSPLVNNIPVYTKTVAESMPFETVVIQDKEVSLQNASSNILDRLTKEVHAQAVDCSLKDDEGNFVNEGAVYLEYGLLTSCGPCMSHEYRCEGGTSVMLGNSADANATLCASDLDQYCPGWNNDGSEMPPKTGAVATNPNSANLISSSCQKEYLVTYEEGAEINKYFDSGCAKGIGWECDFPQDIDGSTAQAEPPSDPAAECINHKWVVPQPNCQSVAVPSACQNNPDATLVCSGSVDNPAWACDFDQEVVQEIIETDPDSILPPGHGGGSNNEDDDAVDNGGAYSNLLEAPAQVAVDKGIGVASSRLNLQTLIDLFDKTTRSLTQSAFAQEQEEDVEALVLFDPQLGQYFVVSGGEYIFEYDGITYSVQLPFQGSTYVIFIDANSNGNFDDGEVQVTETVSSLKLQKVSSTFNYNIKSGLNFVSVPMILDNATSATDLLKQLNTQHENAFDFIARYDGSWRVVADTENSATIDTSDFQVVPGAGYVLKANKDVSIQLTGKEVVYESASDKAPLYLTPGWNLVGLYGTGTKGMTARMMIEGINDYQPIDFTADNVSRWPAEKGRYEGLQAEQSPNGAIEMYGFDFPLDQKSGYFVRVLQGQGEWEPGVGK